MSDPTPSGPTNAAGDGEVITEDSAKQGRRGLHVVAILAASLALVLVAFVVIFATHAHTPRDATPATIQANNRTMNGGT